MEYTDPNRLPYGPPGGSGGEQYDDLPPPQRNFTGRNLSISMANGSNVPRSALSPAGSVAGSEWSGISAYTPGVNGPPVMRNGTPGPQSPPSGRPSPPSSIARSSDGMALYSQNEGRNTMKSFIMEEEVAAHHNALRIMLQPYLSQKGAARPNKARDKLLRLSAIQFQELSTDVYDELQRRSEAEGPGGAPPGHPPHLLPREDFHPKRNHAREKLSTLPLPRFRDLATDVFYELERRFPQFNSGLISPTQSMDGRGMPPIGRIGSPGPMGPPGGPGGMGMPPRVGSPGPRRMGSPGPGMMGRGGPVPYSPGGPGGPGPGGPNGYGPRGPPPRGPPPPGPPGGRGMPPPMSPGQYGQGPEGNVMGRPLPRGLQSGNVVPNKSMMVEDDEDGSDDDARSDAFRLDNGAGNGRRNTGNMGRRESARSMASGVGNEMDKKIIEEYRAKIEKLEEKVANLESNLEEKEDELQQLRVDERKANDTLQSMHEKRDDWEDLRLDLEGKLADAENLNDSLRSEIEKLKSDNSAQEQELLDQLDDLRNSSSARERDLTSQLEDLRNQPPPAATTTSSDNSELLAEIASLKSELREQEEVTDDVRREAMAFLTQMKTLTLRADESITRESALESRITTLESELTDWKTRYAKAKTTIRSIRASSMGLQVPTTGGLLGGKDANMVDPNGLVKAMLLTKFQISIDELLRVARGINYTQSMDSVRNVVLATRAITEPLPSPDSHPELAKLVQRVSATANNLTTAAKNHAVGGGLSPVSLLDAAASHLTAAVIELIKVAKLRPTMPGDDVSGGDGVGSGVGEETIREEEEDEFLGKAERWAEEAEETAGRLGVKEEKKGGLFGGWFGGKKDEKEDKGDESDYSDEDEMTVGQNVFPRPPTRTSR